MTERDAPADTCAVPGNNGGDAIRAAGARVLTIPEPSLVVLVGASGSGKSTFAARHFRATEVLSSDHYRGVVGDDPSDQSVTEAAFDALHHIAHLRLALGRLTVVDATNVKPQDRAHLVRIAREHDLLAVAVVLNQSEAVCRARNEARPDRQYGAHVIRTHVNQLRRGLRGLAREGFRYVHVLDTPEVVEAVRVVREPLRANRVGELGPFDLVGDVHGCLDELEELLDRLGYRVDAAAGRRHLDGRRAVFLGDLVDRGPRSLDVVRLVRRMVLAGTALCVPGNHDVRLVRKLGGRKVQLTHGLAETVAQLEALAPADRAVWVAEYLTFVDGLVSHLVVDGGKLVVAHAGMKEAYQGRSSGRVRAFALYGETTGESDELGLPVRVDWAADYRGKAEVVYGHTPVAEPAWLDKTLNIDTGCVFGGRLTALRWPERELVSVGARRVYFEPVRPLSPSKADGAPSTPDTLLRIEDVQGKQIVPTRVGGTVIIEADRAAAALEVISRFALDPRWLIYLPPTMSPSETACAGGYLEYPTEALAYYRGRGVERVVCEEKHMGSRAVVILCQDGHAAQRRFGVPADGPPGACYTRTGRRFFADDALDRALIERLVASLDCAGIWHRLETDWVCLDAELMPWSAKAQGLLREQYAPVAAAGEVAVDQALAVAETAAGRGLAVTPLVERLRKRRADVARYRETYRAYCWDTNGLDGVRLAPFHLLASEGKTYFDRDHRWHLAELERLVGTDPIWQATTFRDVTLSDAAECEAATTWWLELTERGGEGLVVKPLDFTVRGGRGLVQPAIKCRGRDYLRVLYGPAYTEDANLQRLRRRGLAAKRGLASREFALGIEALERWVQREPLYRVHQAVFAVLALESEPVDPRL